MNNSFLFKDLQNLRYTVTYGHNEAFSQNRRFAWGVPDATMDLTYIELIAHHERLLCPDNGVDANEQPRRTQSFRNQLSTLHSYLAFVGKTTDARVGRELQSDFDARMRAYIDWLNVAPRTKADRRSHLRAWRETANAAIQRQTAQRSAPSFNGGSSDFHQHLRQAFAMMGEAPTAVAKRAGASPSAVQRWLKGAMPNTRALPSVTRIERALKLPPNSLRQLVTHKGDGTRAKDIPDTPAIPYRVRLKARILEEYRFKVDALTPAFDAEWTAFFEYKTTRAAKLNRSQRGKWRLLPEQKIASPVPHGYARKGPLWCVSAGITLEQILGFLGYLTLPRTRGGMGFPHGDVQTLAWLAVPDAVNGYLEFLTARADGLVSGAQAKFAALARCLTHATTGYLTQQPEFQARLPAQYHNAAWSEMCETTAALCLTWKADAVDISRDPTAPIRGLLDLKEPFAPILRAIADLDAEAAAAPAGSLQESICKRDALLLAMLRANPLRRRNYILMTWREDGGGNLYKREDGQWWLRFEANDFKNQKGASQRQYDAPLPRSLSDRVSEYLEDFRPRLLRNHPDAEWLFPSRTSERWDALGRHVEHLTRRLIPGSPGIGPHSFRHLVATDYLRKHPNDFPTVAQLLHDTLATVLRAYAHLRQEDSFAKYEHHLAAAMSQV
ncbi:tyrosine-type recombinase/integrase [Ralstonia pseudosolanacearum]